MSRPWRFEADDEWLAGRRSTFFKRRRSRLAEAVSNAELAPFGGAPRSPRLKVTDRGYSYVRHAERQYSHTTIQVDLLQCRTCGHRLLEEHRLLVRTADGGELTVGWVRMCRRCQKEAWLFTSHMPSVLSGRKRDTKVVL